MVGVPRNLFTGATPKRMEFAFDFLKYLGDIFSLFIFGVIIFWSLRGQRFQWGLSPKGPPTPAFLMRAWLLLGGTYGMCWSSIQFGLHSHFITEQSRAVTLLAFVTNHVGRIVIHLFLILVFAVFGISTARTIRSQSEGTGKAIHLAAVLMAIVVILANLIVLLR